MNLGVRRKHLIHDEAQPLGSYQLFCLHVGSLECSDVTSLRSSVSPCCILRKPVLLPPTFWNCGKEEEDDQETVREACK